MIKFMASFEDIDEQSPGRFIMGTVSQQVSFEPVKLVNELSE